MSFRTVFRHKAFTTMWIAQFLNQIATQAQSVAIGWSVYTIARLTYDVRESMFLVGMIGLAQFLPMLALTPLAGETADRYDRRKIRAVTNGTQIFCAAAFTLLSLSAHPPLLWFFIVAGLYGAGRTFGMPASNSLVPALVPSDVLPKAIAWNTLAAQIGRIVGPLLGGSLCAIDTSLTYATSCTLYCLVGVSIILMLRMPIEDAKPKHNGTSRMTMIFEGLRYLRKTKVVLGAISLDMFAVFLGGVTALLPAYAKDVLDSGPEGLGNLRAAFALGAGVMTLTLALRPITRYAGKWMLGGITLYGAATLYFAFSTDINLSMLALAVAGAADSVSMFVRQSLVQIVTPNEMRGRVSSVLSLFISASNELGEFESGVAARVFGVVGAAAFGGIGSIVVTGLWAKLFPALRQADRLVAPKE
jgi:MFS family permease